MMKKNGFTLIELLAVLAILGTVITIIFSIFHTGFMQGENTKKDVFLQQEANIVATSLRNTHLNNQTYTLTIDNKQIVLNGVVISNQYEYRAEIKYDGTDHISPTTLNITNKNPVMIKITFSDGSSSYTLRTTLSRGV